MNNNEYKNLLLSIENFPNYSSELFKAKMYDFAKESNIIELIDDEESHKKHAKLLSEFIDKKKPLQDDIIEFGETIGGPFRDKEDMNVLIGAHLPPRGGPGIRKKLINIVDLIYKKVHPFVIHQEFETLHPFMDGNGRTGRAIWLWQMINQFGWTCPRAFLHEYYYQALQHNR